MTKQCVQCSKTFVVEPADQAFYVTMNVPEPDACPECRMQRRLAWRNERNFYRDSCFKCKKSLVSQFSPAEGFIVYCETCYWADDWAGQEYAREFDFSQTFGEQFAALNKSVPHMALLHTNSTNSEYTHLAANNKDCYMVIESSNNENCSYSYWIQNSTECVDTSFSIKSQLLYASDDLNNCYRTFYSRSSQDCVDSYFLLNCRNVKNSFGCVNLVNKEYCVFNEQKTKPEYEKFIASKKLDTWAGVQKAQQQFEEFALKQPHKYAEVYKAEGCTGNYIHSARNCRQIFHAYDSENAAYGEHVLRGARDVMDVSTVGIEAELVYDSINTALGVYRMRFTNQCWNNSSDVDYSMYCGSLVNGFGCAAIKKGENVILNKEYSRTEYLALKEKIIDHMKQTGEWGMFLDPKFSPFGYNETAAAELFPLNQADAERLGFRWRQDLPGTFGKTTKQWADIPEKISETPDSVIQEVLECGNCQKNYRITSQELKFYRTQKLPLPQHCPDCRQRSRIQKRNPNQLWYRQCMCTQPTHDHQGRCLNEFQTTYSPERLEVVYCEGCYQKEIV